MKLRWTKGVSVSLKAAAVCAVLGILVAPGWFAFAAFLAWMSFVISVDRPNVAEDSFTLSNTTGSETDTNRHDLPDILYDPAYAALPGNICNDSRYR